MIDEVDLAVKVHANIPAFWQRGPISQGVAEAVVVGGFYERGGGVVQGAGIEVVGRVMHVVDWAVAATELVVIEHSRVETGLLVFRLLGWSGINSSLGEAFFQLYFRIETHKRFSDEAGVQTVSIFFSRHHKTPLGMEFLLPKPEVEKLNFRKWNNSIETQVWATNLTSRHEHSLYLDKVVFTIEWIDYSVILELGSSVWLKLNYKDTLNIRTITHVCKKY